MFGRAISVLEQSDKISFVHGRFIEIFEQTGTIGELNVFMDGTC